jgi:hypothetical protein
MAGEMGARAAPQGSSGTTPADAAKPLAAPVMGRAGRAMKLYYYTVLAAAGPRVVRNTILAMVRHTCLLGFTRLFWICEKAGPGLPSRPGPQYPLAAAFNVTCRG